MSSEVVRVTIRILEKEYQISCPADEKQVMAALNLAHEVINSGGGGGGEIDGSFGQRLKNMRERVETALEHGQQLEF
ncbi:MAG: hypothetical protein P8X53_13910 [Chromatiales bacterium]